MKKQAKLTSLTTVTGFAIFTTLFGAANFMFPPTLGILAGQKSLLAALGFIFTAVILPLAGLVGSFLFEGDYNAFFFRLGKVPGVVLIALCMFIIGPGFVLPRTIHVCFAMLQPYLPWMNLFIFSLSFSTLTFFLAFRPTKLIDILGYYITPIKLTFVGLLIVLGYLFGGEIIHSDVSTGLLLGKGMLSGYGTLDLLGTIFFGSVFLDILKKDLDVHSARDVKALAKNGLVASLIGGAILAAAYTGMIVLGAYQGAGLEGLNPAQILSAISIRIFGVHGGIFGALALMIACLATMIALSTVIAKYIQTELSGNRLKFVPSLLIILVGAVIFSLLNLEQLMAYSIDLAFILYPTLVALTLCNMGYKLFGFTPVKVPVLLVFLGTLFFYFGGFALVG